MKSDARYFIGLKYKPLKILYSFLDKYQVYNSRVMVGLSGGIDSVSLLIALNELKKHFNLEIVAVHVNHNLRGAESNCDSNFCHELASRLGIDIVVQDVHTKELAETSKESIELTARKLRKKIFHDQADKLNSEIIFLAHNLEDQIETILFRMGRGTGIHGLKGILPCKKEKNLNFYRPFLNTNKQLLRGMLEKMNISWREDSSNNSLDFTRNRIRHELFPLFRDIFKDSFPNSIVRLSELSKSLMENFNKNIPTSLRNSIFQSAGGIIIDLKQFSADEFVLGELLRAFFQRMNLNYNMPDEQHIRRIYHLITAEPGKVIDIALNLKAMKDRKFIIISENNFSFTLKLDYSFSEEKKTNLPYPEADQLLFRDLLSGKEISMTYAMNYLDKDDIVIKKIESTSQLKNLFLGRKNLRKLYSDKSVPLVLVETIPLVYYKDELVLVPGIAGKADFIVNQGKSITVRLRLSDEKN